MRIGRFFFTMLSAKRWYRSRKFQVVAVTIAVMCVLYYLALVNKLNNPIDLDITRRKSVIEYIENKLQEALKEDKGTGCEMPKLDPFAKEVTQFDKELSKVVCNGQDWVKCYLSECKVTKEILKTTKDIVCTYRDIIYESDMKYHIGPPIEIPGDNVYTLTKSDHVKIKCTGKHIDSVLPSKWLGHGVGFRNTVKPKKPPPGREDSVNVLILGFDSTSRNGFIRRMPKSYKVLTEELQATVLLGYNIVGDGTPAALFPILTGKTELELPDVRRRSGNTATLDSMPFIFYTLKEDGYRTAYFEDMPWIGTFQYRFNGFRRQPADHYLRSFYLEESNRGRRWDRPEGRYCVGDTPQYRLMLNITQQFLKLDGKRFIFTFIADITHDDFNMIATADDDLADFLRAFQHSGLREDTMLLLMGDHGPRYAKVRETLQGKLEERLPLMAVALPKALAVYRETLVRNSRLLSTPHDIHATLLHALRLRHLQQEYSVRGADFPRGMSLFEPLPTNRSCSEAGVEPHWCACVRWQQLDSSDAFYTRAVEAFVSHLNQLTEPVRDRCVERTLLRVSWVMRQQANKPLLQFAEARDEDGYVGKFTARTDYNVNYQIKVEVGPGRGVYEASMAYSNSEDKFYIDNRDISRTNAYGNEPSCISGTHRHLNMFCFCKGATPHVED